MSTGNLYTFHLGPGRVLTVTLQGDLTHLTLQSTGPGQQQSQQSSYRTGNWRVAPHVEYSQRHATLEIQGQLQTVQVEIVDGQIRTAPSAPAPLPPLPPMKMQLGNMSMHIGNEDTDLRAENLRLREENLRLREENLRLREQWQQHRT
ncbi:MAG: hypothetical protein H7Y22_03405 [Gemmatimonadaceae bacterium]|nr:hypothetical protein [Gloeobacterales cyanobacterium ES-bin-141]